MVLHAGNLIARRYALQGPLDRGAMGAVWIATDKETARRVALKFLDHAALDEDAVRRFGREAKALERLRHPNVVSLLDHGVENGAPFIAMELLEGETLRSLIGRRHPLPPGDVVELLAEAASGLETAHAFGIVHRDVKPSNLFVCAGSGPVRLKVIDFGVAGNVLENDRQSMTRGLIGSPAYMSPEQARGEQLDHMADVWSLAVVAFEALTGREPFAGANVADTLQRICSGEIPRASAAGLGLPPGVDAFFERAFAVRVADRFQSASELVSAMRHVFDGERSERSTIRPRASVPPVGETTIYYRHPEHCVAWYDNVQLILSQTPPSYELTLRIVAGFDALARHCGRGVGGMLVIKSDCPPPDENARRYIMRELSRTPMLAAAQVVEGTGFRGAAMRSALTLMQLARPQRYAMKIFGDVSSSASWLSTQLAELTGHGPDPARLTRAAHALRVSFAGFISR